MCAANVVPRTPEVFFAAGPDFRPTKSQPVSSEFTETNYGIKSGIRINRCPNSNRIQGYSGGPGGIRTPDRSVMSRLL